MKTDRIYVYGTGRYASTFLHYANDILDAVVGFVETVKTKNKFMGKPVYTPDEIGDFDLLIVASQFAYDIKAELYKCNINFEKAVFLSKAWIPAKVNEGRIVFEFNEHRETPYESCVFFDLTGVYTTSREVADFYEENLSAADIWNRIPQYNTTVQAPHISGHQRAMLEQRFIPYLTEKDRICDIGCASGEWCRFLSPHVQEIDGFDISKSMTDTAKALSADYGFTNINYTCMDVSQNSPEGVYDAALMLGVGIFLEEDRFKRLVESVSKIVKKGGYLAVRDTVTMYTGMDIWLVRKGTDHIFVDYRALYPQMKKYEENFTNNGFKIIEERYFCSYMHEPMELGSHGWIFQRV